MSLVTVAQALAKSYHSKQVRKYGGAKYEVHLERVAKRAREVLNSETHEAIGWLHDILEDTDCTADELLVAVGVPVTVGVQQLTSCSKQLKLTLPRATRKLVDRTYIQDLPPDMRVMKAIDRLDNICDLASAPPDWRKKYAEETAELIEILRLPSWHSDLDGQLRRRTKLVYEGAIDDLKKAAGGSTGEQETPQPSARPQE